MATIAYEDLSLHRIEWYILDKDKRSISLANAFGFNHDGQLLNYVEFEGEWINYQVYSLLNSDDSWQQAIKNQGLSKS